MKRFAIAILAGLAASAVTRAAPEYLSPAAVAARADGARLYIAAATAGRVLVFDTASGKPGPTFKLPGNPSGLALSADGARLAVTCAGAPGQVCILDAASGKILKAFPAGHTPVGPCFSRDGATVFVCNRFNNEVAAYDAASGAAKFRTAVVREPIAAALTPDGATLVVANHLPGDAATADVVSAQVSLIATADGKPRGTVRLPNGSTGVRDVAISPDGRFAYVTHTLGRYTLPTTQLDRGWMNTAGLSVIDIAGAKLFNTVLLDEIDRGAANPWGVAVSPDSKWLCIAVAGTHEISIVDRAALHDKLDRLAKGEKVSPVSARPEDAPNDLSFLVGIRRRLPLTGNGPRGIAVAAGKAWACEYFTDSLGVIAVEPDPYAKAASLPLGPKPELTVARKGEMFFNDAALCFQQWQSCASCHPDARADGLNWDLLNDGMGNPKNTKNMLWAHRTPPSMMSGIRESAEKGVRAGIRFIQFAVRPEEDAVAIDEYLKTLTPVPSPYLVNGRLSDAARRGEKIFKKAGCAACHPAPLFTDLKPYNIGTSAGLDEGKEYDTPTLVEAWRTAPYLADGRAATMADVVGRCNPGDKHGATSKLSDQDRADLVEYVLSQ